MRGRTNIIENSSNTSDNNEQTIILNTYNASAAGDYASVTCIDCHNYNEIEINIAPIKFLELSTRCTISFKGATYNQVNQNENFYQTNSKNYKSFGLSNYNTNVSFYVNSDGVFVRSDGSKNYKFSIKDYDVIKIELKGSSTCSGCFLITMS